ncbi:D-arginine dehydrogenase [Hoeflea marina]|uniref:D-arginine dehydrogenase n=1 Tax=Hoeflea marina TaxID=274592 RepID=A0A317PED8_9HYPH|nr:FAD-binding oxidoreductase [Hoeflea marina]PWV97770.1 D-arginine dehydrogenase [Hoeflea marina]
MPNPAHGQSFDIVVIGAGIAGASAAAELASGARVALIEMEQQPGYHTTGRSAAVFAPSYGPPAIRALTRASRAFFENPPAGFAGAPLFSPRGILMIARRDQLGALDALIEAVSADSGTRRVEGDVLDSIQPLLRPGYAAAGMHDAGGQDIDVNALHQGYLRSFRAAGGTVITSAAVTGLGRTGEGWEIETRQGALNAAVIINAAGAWADEIGTLAGAGRIGLTPKRRTAMVVAEPAGTDCAHLPITIDVEEEFYLKPDAGRLLISPADETPSEPCDAQPEELDVAIGVDRIITAFALDIRRIDNKWAGLRSFVADGSPVIGYSGLVPGFYWLAGQGGYGIQSAPAISQFVAAQVLGRALPDFLHDHGFDPASTAPVRPGVAA